eukprot:3187314-Prymnesium_polylepis.1
MDLWWKGRGAGGGGALRRGKLHAQPRPRHSACRDSNVEGSCWPLHQDNLAGRGTLWHEDLDDYTLLRP